MVEVEAARAVNVDLSERLITFLDKVLTGTPAKGQLVNFWAFASFTLDDGVLGGFASGARTVVYKCVDIILGNAERLLRLPVQWKKVSNQSFLSKALVLEGDDGMFCKLTVRACNG